MTHILVIHKVQDFKKWKPVFDGEAVRRKSAGCRLFQSVKDSNEVAVFCQWKDLGSAHQFVESADTHRAMENAGVVGKPDLYFLEETGNFSA